MVSLKDDKKHLIIKRDGRTESYDHTKLFKVILWACDNNENLANTLINSIDIKIYNKIHIDILYDEVIDTAQNLVSRITPQYEEVSKNLYIQKMYKRYWRMNRDTYPSLVNYLKVLIDNKVIIDVFKYFTEEELQELNKAIVPSRDKLSSYLGLRVFEEKYAFRVDNNIVELLQHGFMRLAIQGYIYDKSNQRIEKIINRYNNLSLQYYIEATPKWLNSLRPSFQAASCCVHKMEDNTESINRCVSDIGQYSRFGGGNAVDISTLRAFGSKIGTSGASSGPIPFIKMIESSVDAYNQLGKRPGICGVYTTWWHADIMSILMLLDEGGKESQRARKLKYIMKMNRYFLRAVKEDKDIHLFDPKDVPLLNSTYGEEFDKEYEKYISKNRSTAIIKARDLMYKFVQQRAETGSWYVMFPENMNEQSPFKDMIHSSNICMEIRLPTKAPSNFNTSLIHNVSTDTYKSNTETESGLTALCNLSAINIKTFIDLSLDEQRKIIAELLEASDNLIDWQFYPTKEGELFNRNYRAIGIGWTNLAYYFASEDIKFSSKVAIERTTYISIHLKKIIEEESEKLALKRGNFTWYNKTNLTKPSRFATTTSLPPVATSALIISSTEGVEPVSALITEKTGTYSIKQVVPELSKLADKYELANDVPTKALYDLAAIRQKYYLDQTQSINTYVKDPTSAYEIVEDIIYAESIGLNTLYYLQSTTTEVCESCAV